MDDREKGHDMDESTTAAEITPHSAMRAFLALREKIADHEKQIKVFKQQQESLLNWLNAAATEQGLKGFSASDCLSYKEKHTSYTVKDRGAFLEHCFENDERDAVHSRVSSEYAAAYIKKHGAPPPGIAVREEIKMHVRRVGEID